MAKKNKNERVILEDIELKPQVIGYIYQKKSNIGRVIFIFIVFLLVVYYINDISVFINKLIGKESAETIENLAGSNNQTENNDNKNNEKNEVVYNIYVDNMTITEENMILNNFLFSNNILTFDISNNTNNQIDYSKKKYYIEVYSENKTLLERLKLDINSINVGAKISYNFNVKNNFYYLALVEKTIDDYPIVTLKNDVNGIANITCTKDIENIVYTFRNNELETIKHTIIDNNITDKNYYTNYSSYQSKMTTYNNIAGISATFNGTLNGYTAIVDIDLVKANLVNVSEKYYYGYKELPKVVKFEMQAYGFTCK